MRSAFVQLEVRRSPRPRLLTEALQVSAERELAPDVLTPALAPPDPRWVPHKRRT